MFLPAHNEERALEATLRSLLTQQYPEERFEIIAIENGSTDATLEIAQRTARESDGARVQVLQSARGVSRAKNRGIEALSRTMATELAPYRILVNCVAPGATYSELTTPMYTESVKRALFQRVPLKEIAQPEWIAAGVVFLASEDARYMTGQVLTIDGGYVMDGSLPGAEYWTE